MGRTDPFSIAVAAIGQKLQKRLTVREGRNMLALYVVKPILAQNLIRFGGDSE